MDISLKKSNVSEVASSREQLELRYREVRSLRQKVSQLEMSLYAVAPRIAFQKPVKITTRTIKGSAKMRTLH
jgi:hypothetical protein